MRIMDFLFGKKKTVSDEFFGIIESSRIKGNDSTKMYSWVASYKMPNALEKSTLIMNGNNQSPDFIQLKEIKKIVENIKLIETEIDKKLKTYHVKMSTKEIEYFENWKSKLYLGAIFPLEDKTANFEICFDPIEKESTAFMIFNYINGKLVDIDIKPPKHL